MVHSASGSTAWNPGGALAYHDSDRIEELIANYPENALAYRGVDCKHSIKSPSCEAFDLRPAAARATKNINSESNDSTVNVVAAGSWPASSIFGPQQDPAVNYSVM